MKAYLILEDGTTYVGTAIGECKEVLSEIVFQTAMTGYQEVLSDPSYAGQAIVMTYPLIGNYGVSHIDMESRKPWADAFLVRELAREPSSWRRDNTLENFLKEYHIPGIAGLDTRSLTKHLRRNGTMNGCITTKHYEGFEKKDLLERIRAYRICDVVQRVSVKEPVFYPSGSRNGKKVALIDLGTKSADAQSVFIRQILRRMKSLQPDRTGSCCQTVPGTRRKIQVSSERSGNFTSLIFRFLRSVSVIS